MIFDLYNYLKEGATYSKLTGNNYLFVEYKCPIDTEKLKLMSESNFITYVISGRKDWITSDKVYKTQKGDALFVRKGVYTTRQYLELDYCGLMFFISDEFIRNFNQENNITGKPSDESDIVSTDLIFELDMNEALQALFYSMSNYMKMNTEIPKNLIEIKFKELLFTITLNPKNKKLSQFFAALNHKVKINLDQVMQKNFQHNLQMEEFAKLCGRSLAAFKRDFKTYYKQTPGKWLKDKRLEYAKTLLLHSDHSINEICYESGFKNSSHFNQVFKTKYQVPPKQFRSLNKKS